MSFAPEDNNLAYTIAGIGRKKDPYSERRTMAQRLIAQGMDTSPVQSPWQGVARLAQAAMGGFDSYTADRDEKKATEDRNTKLAAVMAEADPNKRIGLINALDPELGVRLLGQMAVDEAKDKRAREGLGAIAGNYGGNASTAPPAAGYQGTLGGYESGNNPTALNPQSGAGGQFQFIPPTWAEVRAKNPDLNLPADPRQASPELQAEAERRFRASNAQTLQAAGIAPTPAALYLAHRTGAQGAQTLLKADPNAPMASVVPQQWIAQNPDMQGKTVGQFLQMAQARFPGGGGQQPAAPPVTVRATPPGGPPPLQINIPQGAADANGMPPVPSPQGMPGPTMMSPPVPPQRMTPRDMPPQMAAPYLDRLRRRGYGDNPAEAEQRMVADMQRALDVSFENQRIEYDRLLKDYDYSRSRTDKNADRDKERADKQPQQQFDNSNKLRDEFNGSKVVQNYREVTPIMESMKDAVQRPSRAADLNMVYALAKIMDPGSVVREGEMIMVNNTQGIGDRLAGMINSLNGGAQLTPETRQRIIEEAQSRFKGLESSYKALEDHYGGMSDRFGLRREDVIVPIRRRDDGSTPPGATGGGGGQRQRINLDGKPL